MSSREPELLIGDILESAHKIIDYIGDLSFEAFCADSKTFDAVIRNFEIIGEASGRLPDDFKLAHSQIDWHRIRGFRNRIVHDYMGIDYEIVWEIKNHFLPALILKVSQIVF
ncbi:uncharacterized protein with HEPN domain [Mucilaginibacter frigoritolerans]|uniref:Uncharacterized protein with HEPN domain n=1 Tax=Mucilaginibacter frigoritolerans TaxID=652788 RepID=A0A562U987_9SPHI|nr:DUF86 domain-containing protein [Mucilaginibacter frigoritolerans]TWJ02370.1 uncharacterized protein with HEPN domain [Mucilaginibacter frigoritolerans]